MGIRGLDGSGAVALEFAVHQTRVEGEDDDGVAVDDVLVISDDLEEGGLDGEDGCDVACEGEELPSARKCLVVRTQLNANAAGSRQGR